MEVIVNSEQERAVQVLGKDLQTEAQEAVDERLNRYIRAAKQKLTEFKSIDDVKAIKQNAS